MIRTDYLYDKEFLKQLMAQRLQEKYIKIIVIDKLGQPLDSIEGKATSGSINIDGASSVRRTCSISLLSTQETINDYYWTLTNQFRVEVGLKNIFNPKYPSICWFNQGTFVITSFNNSLSTNGYTINISGKDKMCLLNGEVSGSLPASIDFATIEIEDSEKSYTRIDNSTYWKNHEYIPNYYYIYNNLTQSYQLAEGEYDNNVIYYTLDYHMNKTPLLLTDIIREIVHTYGQEPYENIIIRDLNHENAYELLEYRGDTPLYIFCKQDGESSEAKHGALMTTWGETPIWYRLDENSSWQSTTLAGTSEIPNFSYQKLNDLLVQTNATHVKTANEGFEYTLAKIEYGQAAGYRLTDFIYPGELISSIGESITSVLDKIKNILTDYEYFYDLDGHFIFQKNHLFLNQAFTSLLHSSTGSTYNEVATLATPYSFEFNSSNLLQSINNTPNILNIKNDYCVWGNKTTASGQTVPVHMRVSFHDKPISYTRIQVGSEDEKILQKLYGTPKVKYVQESVKYTSDPNSTDDIYEPVNLAQENYKKDTFYYKDNDNKYIKDTLETFTKDRAYYQKLKPQLDWRELIYRMACDYFKYGQWDQFEKRIVEANQNLYPNGITGYEQYYTELEAFWRELYNPNYNNGDEYFQEDSRDFPPYWNKNAAFYPELLNFWLDFYDEGELVNYNINNIGLRSKIVNNNKLTGISFNKTPAAVFKTMEELKKEQDSENPITSDYPTVIYTTNQMNYFTSSTQGMSCQDEINNLLYQFSYCAESISLNAIPIYYLEPNTRIYINDEQNNIKGDYLLSKITIPLTYNGTMQLTATKAIDRIY